MSDYLIIAGTVKGGTTSLYSYLSRHEEINSSKIKETCYFLPLRYKDSLTPIDEYIKLFPFSEKKYNLEATPGYFEGGKVLAEKIKNELGDDVKIIITLRDPVKRLISFFNYKKAQLELEDDMELDGYIDLCMKMDESELSKQINDQYYGVLGGFYFESLTEWYEVFGNNLKIVFFEEISDQPLKMLNSLAEWLEMDSTSFQDLNFTVENKTVPIKNKALQNIAIKVNYYLEPVLRKMPLVKNTLREMYYLLNGKNRVVHKEFSKYYKIYADDLVKLENFLSSIGYNDLPLWLKQNSTELSK